MPQPISIELRNQIVSLHSSGCSFQEISSQLGVSVSTVHKWVQRFQSTHNVSTSYRGSNSILSDEDKELILLKWVEDHFKPATVIRKELELTCTPRTINNFLKTQGIFTHHAATKTRMNEKTRFDRIAFACLFQDLDINKCIFVDESCFSSARDGIRLVKRPRNTRYESEFTNKSDHCSRKVVSTWAAITCNGLGPLVPLDCRLNANVYVEILDTFIVYLVRSNFGSDECYLIQDNCPAHRSHLVQEWFECCSALHHINLKLICLPPYSPELNLIENVWGECKYDFLNSNFIPQSQNEMKEFVLSIWNKKKSQPNFCSNLFGSWIKRCDDVMRNDGFPIKY